MELIRNDELWFGNYGGCFIADAFSLHCDKYYKQFESLINTDDFKEKFEELKKEFKPEFKLLDNHTILIPENFYAILGTALLYKSLHKSQALVACRYVDEALFTAKICKKLDINLKMYVTKELSQMHTLMSELKLMGVNVCTKQCQDLVNHPEMYSFQEWLAESEDKHLINIRCNVGAFPQVNISSYFVKQYCEEFKKFLNENNIKFNKMAMPVVSGTSALGLINDENIKYVTYECDDYKDLKEELDSFCGTFTKVERNNLVDRVLCPQLCKMWDDGKVERKIVDISSISYEAEGLSLQSLAVLNNEKDLDTLRVVKKLRIGTNL